MEKKPSLKVNILLRAHTLHYVIKYVIKFQCILFANEAACHQMTPVIRHLITKPKKIMLKTKKKETAAKTRRRKTIRQHIFCFISLLSRAIFGLNKPT